MHVVIVQSGVGVKCVSGFREEISSKVTFNPESRFGIKRPGPWLLKPDFGASYALRASVLIIGHHLYSLG